jgi:hypothetical protein
MLGTPLKKSHLLAGVALFALGTLRPGRKVL